VTAERLGEVVADGELPADDLVVVRVADGPVRRDELDAHDVVRGERGPHGLVEGEEAGRGEAPLEVGLDEQRADADVREHRRLVLRGVEGAVADLPRQQGLQHEGEGRDGDQAEQREPPDEAETEGRTQLHRPGIGL
jgi:hypothetical protein